MAFKSNYPWLKDLKEKTAKKNNAEITKITILGGSPIRGRTDIQFTGYGQDGQLQPSKPTGMFNAFGGPVMEHEGEARIEHPDGEKTVIPASQLDQGILEKLEGKMRGAQMGGSFLPPVKKDTPFKKDLTNITGQKAVDYDISKERLQNLNRPVQPVQNTTPVNISQPQTVTPVNINQPEETIQGTTPVNISQPQTVTPQTITQPGTTMPTTTPISITQPETQPQIGTARRPQDLTPGLQKIGGLNRPDTGVTKTSERFMPEKVRPIGAEIPEPSPTPTPTPAPTPTPTPEESPEYQQALRRLEKSAEGISPVDQKIREEERMRLAGEEAAARTALEQYGSQLGLSDREMLTEQAMLGRNFGAQEVALMAALRKGEADRAFQATMALPGATLAGMQFKLNKEQWDKQFDFEHKKWEDMTDLEKSKFNWNKEIWQKGYDLDKEQWEKQFEENNRQWQQLFDFGMEKWDYGTKLDFVNTLVQQGGAENYARATEVLNSIYGEPVDFSNAITAENQANFFNGMDVISSSIASGLSWEDTLKALEENDMLDRMGMTESDLKSVFDHMKLNSDPLYQAIQMADGWLEQGWINQEQYDDFLATVRYGLTNHEGFNIEDGFMLLDENGNEVEFFKTQAEMEEYMKNNPGNYQAVKTQNHITPIDVGPGTGTGTGTGTTGGVKVPDGVGKNGVFIKDGIVYKLDENGVPQELFDHTLPENAKAGDTFVGDGNLYVLGSGGVARQITDEVLSNIWSDDANLAVKHGDDSPYRKSILDKRVDDIMAGNYPEGNVFDTDTYNAVKGSDKSPTYNFKVGGASSLSKKDSFDNDGKKESRYIIDEFENLTEGSIIVVNGRVLKYRSKFRKGRGGTDGTGYDFYDMNNGEKVRIYDSGEINYT